MQGQRSALNSFPEIVDLNQEYVSNSNSMDYPTWNDVLNPVESRLPHNSRSFSGWDLGESSSSANLRDHISGDGLKMDDLSSLYSASAAAETRLEECRFEPSNILLHDRVTNGLGSNQVTWGPPSMQISGSDHYPANVNLNARYTGNNDDGGQGIGAGILSSFYKSGRPDAEQIPSASMPSGDIGTSSRNSSYFVEDDDGSGSSTGSWGLSCKRKALEGTSAQPYPGGSTSCLSQSENTVPHIVPARNNASSSLSTSSRAVNSLGVGLSEQLNPRFGVGVQGVASDVFPPLSVTGTAENSTRNFGSRGNLGYPEPVPFNLPSAGISIRRSSNRSSHQSSRSISFSDSLEFGPTTPLLSSSTNPSNQPHLMHGPGLTRNMPLNWNDMLNSRTGSSSSSLTLPGERGVGLREDAGFRSSIRNNAGNPMFVPVIENRNSVQDPTNWSLGTGSSSSSGGVASSSRVGSSSSSRPLPTAWLPHHNPQTQNQLRLSDFAPWTPFQSVESEAGVQRGHFSPFASGPSSPEETVTPSGSSSQGHHQPYSRSALLMEVPGDDVNGWSSLVADIDGRQRLVSEIRHVLNAMQRGQNLRAEDYMFFDPFINGVAELHDRHRDMRLDVDNMSYEELLALEERIGNVNTGLNEEIILQFMKQRKYLSFMIGGAPSKIEPCCICQEEYVTGETIGTLNCGHEFHTDCVKRWLLHKNLCPICKMTALTT